MHRQFTDVLADLHVFDWRGAGLDFLGVPDRADDPAALEIDRCTELLDRIALRPYPALREVIEWLRDRRPSCPRLSLIHDDYRMGNFIWRADRIAAILDWERAFIGDPMADVAFTRIEALAGWCSIRSEMAKRYSDRSGIAVDEDRVVYCKTLEQLKATLVGLTGLKAFAEGRTSDLRLVQIGRGGHHGIAGLTQAIGLGK
jgi:aminoglycoside phosphotransferase (APT) family kinase protein